MILDNTGVTLPSGVRVSYNDLAVVCYEVKRSAESKFGLFQGATEYAASEAQLAMQNAEQTFRSMFHIGQAIETSQHETIFAEDPPAEIDPTVNIRKP